MTTKSITSGQQKQVKRFAEDAVDRAIAEGLLDKDGIQKLIERGDEFQARIITGIKELSVSNQPACPSGGFVDEEVESSYTYPNGYKVKGVAEQIKIIHESFPEVRWGYFRPDEEQIILPSEAEGLFAIPRWEKIASAYGEAVEKVLAMIASKRKFYNYREGQTGPEYLRQHAKTVKAFQKLGDEQKGHDILIVPCQFGLRHRGRSVRRAREVMNAVEFGLGAFAIGIMLLTHPKREVQWEQLHVDCAGDEFAPDADGGFSHAPVFDFDFGGVGSDAHWVGHAYERYGSASAFVI